MGLKLKNEFTVGAPLDKTWETLLDIGRVASCMPGAKLDSGGEDGVYRGTMKVKLGPMNIAYQGAAKLAEVDEDKHACVLDVKAKEQRGTGTASATITNRLSEAGEGTKVEVETDLAITGRQAQFGRGIMEDVASKMLGDFAARLEQEILSGGTAGAEAKAEQAKPSGEPSAAAAKAETPPVTPVADDDDDDVLDLGNVVAGPVAKRAAIGAGVAAIVLVILFALLGRGGRKSERSLDLKLRL
jgi:carbon monoxide dehydrogenase subunit G